ncbi:MAG: hypothetical protein KDJ65_03765 [Anaerolineae bacterium]|nr:hypothetical protein [Anaerolineae bacterium]
MKIFIIGSIQYRLFMLLPFLIFLLACGLVLQTPTPPTPQAEATIGALMIENARLTNQLATIETQVQLASIQAPTATLEPTPTFPSPTTTPIFTASPTMTPPQPTATVVFPTATPTPPQKMWIVQSIMFTPKLPNRLYALQRHYPDLEYRLMFSDDIGQSWQFLLNNFPVEFDCLNDITLDYNVPNTFYASTCQGLYHWSSNSWTLVSSHPMGTVALVSEKPQTVWGAEPFGPTEVPIIRSDNGGGTWTPVSRYLNHTNGISNVLVDPSDNERLYAVVWPEYADSYLRRGSANGQWTDLPTPLSNSPIGDGLAIDGDTGTVYVIIESHQLWSSSNANSANINSVQWKLVSDFNDQQAELLGAGWHQGELALFINLKENEKFPVLHRSLDRGHVWSPLPISQ